MKIIFLFFLFCISVFAQLDDLKSQLTDAGFENIKIKIIDNKLFLSYEDRVNRFNASGLAEVLELVEEWGEGRGKRGEDERMGNWEDEMGQKSEDRKQRSEDGDYSEVQILMLKDNIPITLLKKNEAGINITHSTDEINNLLRDEERENSSLYKFDIIIHPGLKTQFGNYDNPVRAQVNIIPEIRTSLWRGMTLSAQAIIPLYNEFPGEGEYVRPGITALNQILYLNEAWFFSSTAGYFTENRYGVAAETRKTFWDGIFSVGAEAGYTGFLSIFNNKIIYSYPYYWTALADVELRISKYDLTLGVTAGNYLYNDRSVRFDINRQFGEVEIGFFFNKSFKYDSNGGINFSIPIFPSSYSAPGIVRIRPADNFSYEYRVRGKIYNFSGRMFETGFSLKKDLNRYNPSFIENNVVR